MNIKAYSYIRFSTPQQSDGDSRNRQSKLINDFVTSRELELDESLHISDYGVSGFRGANLEKGLGKFIQAIDSGRIAEGSYLLIESLDRLSRERVSIALQLFLSILNKGINIATLSPTENRVYSKDPDIGDLLISIMIMSRAHEESAIKSQRLSSSWKAKRENANNVKMTSRAPAWLKLNKVANRFEVITDRADVVRRIYQLSDNGIGKNGIAKIINGEGLPTFSGGKYWHNSYIEKILKNDATIGIIHPHKTFVDPVSSKRTREPDGPAISNYYPKIISEELYNRVQYKRKSNANKTSGRKGTRFSNLFTRIAKCGYCGSTMQFVNKGKSTEGSTYLVCGNSRVGAGCKYKSWKYDHFEFSFLSYCKGLDFSEVVSGKSQINDIKRLSNRLDEVNGEKLLHEKTLLGIENSIIKAEGDISTTVYGLALSTEDKIVKAKTSIALLEQEIASMNEPILSANETQQSIQKLMDDIAQLEGSSLYETRAMLHQKIIGFIESIIMFPSGIKDDGNKFYAIKYKSGELRLVRPRPNPADFDALIDASTTGDVSITDNADDVFIRWMNTVISELGFDESAIMQVGILLDEYLLEGSRVELIEWLSGKLREAQSALSSSA